MYAAYHDGETIVEPTEDELIKRLFARMGINTIETKLRPDLLGHAEQTPWPMLSAEYRADTLIDMLDIHAPIRAIAQESVLGELEHIQRTGPENIPDDVHPNDSDSHTVELDDWLDEHVAAEQFDSDVWAEVHENLQKQLRNTVADKWAKARDQLGTNPARAEPEEITQYIEQYE